MSIYIPIVINVVNYSKWNLLECFNVSFMKKAFFDMK